MYGVSVSAASTEVVSCVCILCRSVTSLRPFSTLPFDVRQRALDYRRYAMFTAAELNWSSRTAVDFVVLTRVTNNASCNVQIPLGGPDQTLSETRVGGPSLRQSPPGPRGSPTSPRTLSGRIRSGPCSGIWHGPDQTLSLVGSGRVVSEFHYTNPRTLSATRPDQTHGQSPYMSRLSGQVYDQIKTTDVCGDPSGPWFWSGRVRVVRNLETTRPDPTSDKVWPGPSSGSWT